MIRILILVRLSHEQYFAKCEHLARLIREGIRQERNNLSLSKGEAQVVPVTNQEGIACELKYDEVMVETLIFDKSTSVPESGALEKIIRDSATSLDLCLSGNEIFRCRTVLITS